LKFKVSGSIPLNRGGRSLKLKDIACIIRSKNAGQFILTLDIMFKDRDIYEKVKNSGIISKELISEIYNIPIKKVISVIEFDIAKAIKINILRPYSSGDVKDGDVYGSQQYFPLLEVDIPDNI